jgi:hypothetical protein
VAAVDATRHESIAVSFDSGLAGRTFPRHRLCDLPWPGQAVSYGAQLPRSVAVLKRPAHPAFEVIRSFDRLDAVDHRLAIHERALAFGAQEVRSRRVRVGRERRRLSGLHGISHSGRSDLATRYVHEPGSSSVSRAETIVVSDCGFVAARVSLLGADRWRLNQEAIGGSRNDPPIEARRRITIDLRARFASEQPRSSRATVCSERTRSPGAIDFSLA